MIYLDNGATTKVAEEVVKRMNEVMLDSYGNPSSLHSLGQEAHSLIEETRELVAKELNANAEEIIFTSGGSEANNLALNLLEKGDHFITSKIEHHSIEVTVKELEKKGIEVTLLKVDEEGNIDLDMLKNNIKKN